MQTISDELEMNTEKREKVFLQDMETEKTAHLEETEKLRMELLNQSKIIAEQQKKIENLLLQLDNQLTLNRLLLKPSNEPAPAAKPVDTEPAAQLIKPAIKPVEPAGGNVERVLKRKSSISNLEIFEDQIAKKIQITTSRLADENSQSSASTTKVSKKVMCEDCNTEYKSQSALNKHKKKGEIACKAAKRRVEKKTQN